MCLLNQNGGWWLLFHIFFTSLCSLSRSLSFSLVLSLCKRKRAPTLINKEAQHTKKHEGASIAFKSKKQEEEEQKRQEIYTHKRSAEGQKQQH
jgi:hypothetical protein